ncbi:dTDP-glucose 4,6-dehydratase [Paenibacillus sp. GbtcB18]|uniref:dTDP-glucose 4,6-dehydratase n=1 Tax=Paenibacillus sp. GbtcB18 TaxID=2824763 RepID=UPI001C308824|nr:dTDP-glucose 4,6-dehydratase [Paenibacillus sp. GbtcB18]
MKLLITGGAGFIGTNFILYMLKKYPHYQIINLDALTYAGNLNNLKQVEHNPRYTFIHADITDRAFVSSVFEQKIDVVVNFAAESHVDRSIVQPDIFVNTNVLGTQVLLDAARSHKVTKFIQVSTDEVYGSLGETGLFSETSPLSANSPYSASKAGADLLVRAYHETFGLPVNITRCSNNYGPYQFPEKLIPLMILNALEDKDLPVYGDGQNIRDWLYVDDHCSALDLVIHKGQNGEVYNIGGNNERTNLTIVKTILRELGKSEERITYVRDRPGHDRRYAIDSNKITRELGWKPQYELDKGIKETILWYLQNKSWWENIQSGAYQDYYSKQNGTADE